MSNAMHSALMFGFEITAIITITLAILSFGV